MKSKVIDFKVTKIGMSSTDKLYAVIESPAPVKQVGILKVKGSPTRYRMYIDEMPEGLKFDEVSATTDKEFTKSVGDIPVPIPHVQLRNHEPFKPVGYNVRISLVTGDDGIEREIKWLEAAE